MSRKVSWLATLMAFALLHTPAAAQAQTAASVLAGSVRDGSGAPIPGVTIRVVNEAGREVPSQVTEVTTWEPASRSIKWVWVFFFAETSPRYFVEYGPTVRRGPIANRIEFINQTRDNGLAEINTGPMRVVVRQGEMSWSTRVGLTHG